MSMSIARFSQESTIFAHNVPALSILWYDHAMLLKARSNSTVEGDLPL
jgi:hypothetical protein